MDTEVVCVRVDVTATCRGACPRLRRIASCTASSSADTSEAAAEGEEEAGALEEGAIVGRARGSPACVMVRQRGQETAGAVDGI